jgi:hypothetical protein
MHLALISSTVDLRHSNWSDFVLKMSGFSLVNITHVRFLALSTDWMMNNLMPSSPSTPSEYIQIISAGIYAAALFFTIITFRRTKRLDQISLSDTVFKELRNLELATSEISLFDCFLCCKALVLCLFIVSAAVLDVDFAAVPYPSSNVPFPVHGFKQVFHF